MAIVAQWDFDGDFQDSAGSNHGEGKGTPEFADSLIGGDGQSLQLDGTTQYVTVPSAAALQITGSYWFSAWFQRTNETGLQPILEKGEVNYFLWMSGERVIAGHLSSGGFHQVEYNGGMVPGRAYKVDAVYTGSKLILYVNGRQVKSASVSEGPISTSEALLLGSGEESFWPGRLDKIVLRNSSATAAEVLAAYRDESPTLLAEGFEGGSIDTDYYAESKEGSGSKIEVVSTDPTAYDGTYALRSQATNAEAAQRAEIKPAHCLVSAGDEIFLRCRVWLGTGFPSEGWGSVLWQLRDEGDGSPVVGLYVYEGHLRVSGGPATGLAQTIYWEGPDITTGEWFDVLVRVVCAESPDDGVVEVWLDEVAQEMEATAGQTALGLAYPKFGIYRDPTNTTTGVVGHDLIAITREMPAIEEPEPEPGDTSGSLLLMGVGS